MPEVIAARYYDEQPTYFRPKTYDSRILDEVIDKKTYRRVKLGFDVESGEHWLDLGANIGAFAVYCRLNDAVCDSYEPEPGCFTLLKKNVGKGWKGKTVQAAVSSDRGKLHAFYASTKEGNHTRGCIHPLSRSVVKVADVPNVWAGSIKTTYDGIKMDIEGGEFELLDNWLLPPTRKLVLEYHSSRDRSAKRLAKRLAALESRFDHVHVSEEMRRIAAGTTDSKPMFDRLLFAWNDQEQLYPGGGQP